MMNGHGKSDSPVVPGKPPNLAKRDVAALRREAGENLQDLSERLKRGAYRAKPVRRVYIPKADGRQRPLGVPALEDKIVQRAAVEVLNAIYETDFLGFLVRVPTRAQPASSAGCARTVGIC